MPLTKIQSLGITDGTIVNADINASAAIASTKLSGSLGKILQVLQVTKTDSFTTTSNSFVDITGFSVSITPSSISNKILVMVTMSAANAGGDINHAYFQLVRNSTAIFNADTAGSRTSATKVVNTSTAGVTESIGINFLDSPATTSSTTYKIQVLASGSGLSANVNRSGRDNDGSGYDGRSVSSITVMEIAA